MKLLVPVIAIVAMLAVCAGAASPARATDYPGAIARQILGHAPAGLAKVVVRRGFVRVATDANYPPQSFIDPATDRPAGFDVSVARRVRRILGLGIRFKFPAWEHVAQGLQRGRFDVSIGSMLVTPQRQATLGLSRPYYYLEYQAFVRKGGTQITGLSDLAGKTVGVGSATVFFDYVRKHSTAVVMAYPTDDEALQALDKGELDFAVTSPFEGITAIDAGAGIEFSGRPLHSRPFVLATRRGETDWLKLLDYAVATMRRDGSLARYSKRWFDGLDLTTKQ
jgi:ABC-type amino acid transport substrate-binding protein